MLLSDKLQLPVWVMAVEDLGLGLLCYFLYINIPVSFVFIPSFVLFFMHDVLWNPLCTYLQMSLSFERPSRINDTINIMQTQVGIRNRDSVNFFSTPPKKKKKKNK